MPQSVMSVPTLGYGAPGNSSDRLFSQGAIKVRADGVSKV